jgi:ATP-dependent helicase/DNAse subunit B
VSATRLETWARCPHAYFARYLLHLDAIERPEEIVQLSPLERGKVVHEALDRFLAELIGVAGVGRPWVAGHRDRLHEILRETCDEVEARGMGGRRLLWERARRELHAELDEFLDVDGRYREETGAETIATELQFGWRDAPQPAVEMACSDGRTLHFAGSADRIDRLADGRLSVIDYKTGGLRAYQHLSADDPLLDGQYLQLPIYAHATRAVLGIDREVPVEAWYWFTKEPKKRRGYLVDLAVEKALDDALLVIIDGIEAGMFVDRPPEPDWRATQGWIECAYCDPDGLGTADRHRDWTRKLGAPELAEYLALVGIPAPDTSPAA